MKKVFLFACLAGLVTVTACAGLPDKTVSVRQPSVAAPVAPAEKTAPGEPAPPETKRQPVLDSKASEDIVSPPPVRLRVKPVEMDYVSQRLALYEKKLEQTGITAAGSAPEQQTSAAWQSCSRQLKELVRAYRRLDTRLAEQHSPAFPESGAAGPLQLYRRDIEFLESGCNRTLRRGAPAQTRLAVEKEDEEKDPFLTAAVDQETKQLAEQIENGDYQEALATYQRLTGIIPETVIPPASRAHYARALQHSGQTAAATEVYLGLLEHVERFPAPWSLRRRVADLLLAAGRLEDAAGHYQTLARAHDSMFQESTWAMGQLDFLQTGGFTDAELSAYTELLRDFLIQDYRIHGDTLNRRAERFLRSFPEGATAVAVRRLQQSREDRLTDWLGDQLKDVDRLAEDKQYEEALARLERLAAGFLTERLRNVVRKTLDEVSLARAEEQERQRQLAEEARARQWEEAVTLLDTQQYDQAIAGFRQLLDTGYDDRARRKIEEAAGEAAAGNRQEAANLFIKAGKADDPERKKELLLASRRLLRDILVKYPEVEIIDKVSHNLEILENHIRRVDPSLLETEKPEEENLSAAGPAAVEPVKEITEEPLVIE